MCVSCKAATWMLCFIIRCIICCPVAIEFMPLRLNVSMQSWASCAEEVSGQTYQCLIGTGYTILQLGFFLGPKWVSPRFSTVNSFFWASSYFSCSFAMPLKTPENMEMSTRGDKHQEQIKTRSLFVLLIPYIRRPKSDRVLCQNWRLHFLIPMGSAPGQNQKLTGGLVCDQDWPSTISTCCLRYHAIEKCFWVCPEDFAYAAYAYASQPASEPFLRAAISHVVVLCSGGVLWSLRLCSTFNVKVGQTLTQVHTESRIHLR